MLRITLDIDGDDTMGTKEAVAYRIEELGRVRIVSIKPIGTGAYRLIIDVDGDDTRASRSTITMLLEPLGKVRVVSVDDGKTKK